MKLEPMEKMAGSMGLFCICLTLVFPPGCNALGREGYNCLIGGQENMANPTLEAFWKSPDTFSLVLNWQAVEDGAALLLPDAYFSAYSVTDASGVAHTSAEATNTGLRELSLDVSDVESLIDEEGLLEIMLLFPDREDYIPCSHPGAEGGDTYVVILRATFNESLEVLFGEVSQTVWLTPG